MCMSNTTTRKIHYTSHMDASYYYLNFKLLSETRERNHRGMYIVALFENNLNGLTVRVNIQG